ncbi:MAG: hypothetical protein K2I47_04615, partial [Odoribacter sp.]|nr:hypothetical protein [Odoribacter sp.]
MMNGNFALIIKTNLIVTIVADKISSFPLFYTSNENKITITDNLSLISKEKSTDVNREEFLSSGFCCYRNTIYRDVFRVQAGEIVRISNEFNVSSSDYYLHKRNSLFSNASSEMLLKTFDDVVSNTFKRLIEYANGRTIVLLLSGGYDSRLIATNLRKYAYENVICTSFGTSKEKDFTVAKQIASSLGYRFLPVKVNKSYWKELKKSGEINRILESSSAMGSLSHFHLGSIVRKLMDTNQVPDDSVFVTGQSGDAIEGNDVTGLFSHRIDVGLSEISSAIINRHYYFCGYKSLK